MHVTGNGVATHISQGKTRFKLDKHSIVLNARVSILGYILNTYTLNTVFHCSATIGDHIQFAECVTSNSSTGNGCGNPKFSVALQPEPPFLNV